LAAVSEGWPDDWEERKAGRDCFMCASLGLGDNDHTVTIAELPYRDDPAAGGPLTWDEMFAEQPTPPEVLERQAHAIRDALAAPDR
jgi:hypothetical protein